MQADKLETYDGRTTEYFVSPYATMHLL